MTRATSTGSKSQHWAGTQERGIGRGIGLLVWAYRVFGRRFLQLLLYPIIGYFFLTGRKARRASREFLHRVFQTDRGRKVLGTAPKASDSYRHFMEFGGHAVDKFSAWMGTQRYELEWNEGGRQRLLNVAQRDGGVILGAHLGNLEMLRGFATAIPNVRMNVLVVTRHAAQFNRFLRKLDPRVAIELIQVEEMLPDTVILLKEKVDAGEMVVVLADRTSATSVGRVSYANFLGQPAPFPQGPFILAGMLDCPVYTMFCLKEGNRYRVFVEEFADTLRAQRSERGQVLDRAIKKFAERLEHYAISYPYQWYNFYDFWQSDDEQARPAN